MKLSLLFKCLLIVLFISSCQNDLPPSIDKTGSGYLALNEPQITDFTVTRNKSDKGRAESLTPSDFQVDIVLATTEEVILHFDSFDDITDNIPLQIGEYYVQVYNVDFVSAAFDQPYLFGQSQNFTIESFQTKTVDVTVVPSNMGVVVKYSQNIVNTFSSFTTQVANNSGSLSYNANGLGVGYFTVDPLTASINLEFTAPDGQVISRGTTFEITNPIVGRVDTLNIDAEVGVGDAGVILTINQFFTGEDHDILIGSGDTEVELHTPNQAPDFTSDVNGLVSSPNQLIAWSAVEGVIDYRLFHNGSLIVVKTADFRNHFVNLNPGPNVFSVVTNYIDGGSTEIFTGLYLKLDDYEGMDEVDENEQFVQFTGNLDDEGAGAIIVESDGSTQSFNSFLLSGTLDGSTEQNHIYFNNLSFANFNQLSPFNIPIPFLREDLQASWNSYYIRGEVIGENRNIRTNIRYFANITVPQDNDWTLEGAQDAENRQFINILFNNYDIHGFAPYMQIEKSNNDGVSWEPVLVDGRNVFAFRQVIPDPNVTSGDRYLYRIRLRKSRTQGVFTSWSEPKAIVFN